MGKANVYLDKKIPGVKHVKTKHEEDIDSCIPDAAESANMDLMIYERQHPNISKNLLSEVLSKFFLNAMKVLADERGFRKASNC